MLKLILIWFLIFIFVGNSSTFAGIGVNCYRDLYNFMHRADSFNAPFRLRDNEISPGVYAIYGKRKIYKSRKKFKTRFGFYIFTKKSSFFLRLPRRKYRRRYRNFIVTLSGKTKMVTKLIYQKGRGFRLLAAAGGKKSMTVRATRIKNSRYSLRLTANQYLPLLFQQIEMEMNNLRHLKYKKSELEKETLPIQQNIEQVFRVGNARLKSLGLVTAEEIKKYKQQLELAQDQYEKFVDKYEDYFEEEKLDSFSELKSQELLNQRDKVRELIHKIQVLQITKADWQARKMHNFYDYLVFRQKYYHLTNLPPDVLEIYDDSDYTKEKASKALFDATTQRARDKYRSAVDADNLDDRLQSLLFRRIVLKELNFRLSHPKYTHHFTDVAKDLLSIIEVRSCRKILGNTYALKSIKKRFVELTRPPGELPNKVKK